MRTTYKIKSDEYAYFITSTIVDWIPVFNNPDNINSLIEAINFSKERKGLKIFAYVIMPEHFHAICQSDNLLRIIQSIKSYTAKRIIESYEICGDVFILDKFKANKKAHKRDSKYQIWQEGFKPKAILTDGMYKQKINYIHYNPVKRGLAENIEDYKYSSAADYIFCKPGRIILDNFDYVK